MVDTCTDHQIRSLDAASPYWRGSYEHVIGEMIALSDPTTYEILATIWDSVGVFAGGHHGCDGSVEAMLRPLPAWIRENLDG